MKTQTNLQHAWHYNRLLKKKLLAAEAEASRLSYIVESYRVALETACKVAEEAILDRDMYKQHSFDLAKDLEQMREPEWEEEDYLPAPAEGCQCSWCIGE